MKHFLLFSFFLVSKLLYSQLGHIDTTFNYGQTGFSDEIHSIYKVGNEKLFVLTDYQHGEYNQNPISHGCYIDTEGNFIKTVNLQNISTYFQNVESEIEKSYYRKDLIIFNDSIIYAADSKKLAKYDLDWNLISVLYNYPAPPNEYHRNIVIRKTGDLIFLQLNNKIVKFENELLISDNLITYTPQNASIDNIEYFEISDLDSSIYLFIKYGNPQTNGKILKYSFNGNIDNSFNAIDFEYGFAKKIFKIQNNNIYLYTEGSNHSFIIKYDNYGNYDSLFNQVEDNYHFPDFEIDYNDNLLLAAPNFNNEGVYINNTITRYNSYGILDTNFYQEKLYSNGVINDFEILNDGDIIVGGFILGKNGKEIGHILKLHGEPKYDCNNLELHLKKTRKVDCEKQGFAVFSITGGIAPLSFVLDDTITLSLLDTLWFTSKGYHTIKVNDVTGCERKLTFFIGGDVYDPDNYDISVNFISETFVRGFEHNAWLSVTNQSCKIIDVQLVFTLPINVDLVSSFPAPAQSSGNTYRWNIADLDEEYLINLVLKTSTFAQLGGELLFTTDVSPKENDINLTNNFKEYLFAVQGSFDPNDKMNNPSGKCNSNYTLKGDRITYTIRFQNIGNFPAKNVYVLDSLSSFIDQQSLNIIATSDNMNVLRERDQVLKFDFPDINLPGKEIDSVGSIGYVIYEVALKEDVPLFTTIRNKAAIYFDFNEPIITNEVFNTIVNEIPMYNSNVDIEGCIGQTFLFKGNPIKKDTTFEVMFFSSEGCDSLVTYDYNFIDQLDGSLSVSDNNIIATAGYDSYQWIDCATNVEIGGATSHTFTAPKSGNYAVKMSDGDCEKTTNCVFILVSDVDDLSIENSIQVFPNPSVENQGINILFNQIPKNVRVVNSIGLNTGTVIKITEKNYQLNNLNSGFYFLVAEVNGKSITQKLVVMH